MKKKNNDSGLKDFCFRCGSYEVTKLSDGTILCKNKHCGAVTKYDMENNELNIKIKLK